MIGNDGLFTLLDIGIVKVEIKIKRTTFFDLISLETKTKVLLLEIISIST